MDGTITSFSSTLIYFPLLSFSWESGLWNSEAICENEQTGVRFHFPCLLVKIHRTHTVIERTVETQFMSGKLDFREENVRTVFSKKVKTRLRDPASWHLWPRGLVHVT